jgi:sodium-independent sulfate anion transporter 11
MKQTTDDPFFEAEPTVAEELKQCIPTADDSLRYLKSLFPCFGWLPRYNWRWLVGDSIAGLTVGLVVIPQAMAYALLATLPPDFGLYTSFAGAATYWLFGTSKDIVIGVSRPQSFLKALADLTFLRQQPSAHYSSVKSLPMSTKHDPIHIQASRLPKRYHS